MPLFGPTWKKFGERRTRECVPKFRFEGEGVFYKSLDKSRWKANNKSVAFMQLHGEAQDLNVWSTPRHCKCLSNMFINVVQLRITQNSIGKALQFGIYRDEVRLRIIATIPTDIFGPFFTSPPNPPIAGGQIPLVFDSDYAWGFQTVDGTNPTFDNANVTLACTITCLVQMGAGDP